MINAIVAISENNVIGKSFGLPWRLPNDLRWFKEKTINQVVIMGRKTYETIGKPLPNRINIVLSRGDKIEGVATEPSLRAAVNRSAWYGCDEVLVVGGAQVYELAAPEIDTWYITRVHAEVEGDTYLNVDLDNFKLVFDEYHEVDEEHEFPYSFQIYKRKTIDNMDMGEGGE